MAEVELLRRRAFQKPAFIGTGGDGDVRYYNSQPMKHLSPRGKVKPIVCQNLFNRHGETLRTTSAKRTGHLPLVTVFSLPSGFHSVKISLKRAKGKLRFRYRPHHLYRHSGAICSISSTYGLSSVHGRRSHSGTAARLNYCVKCSHKYHVFGVTTIIIAPNTYCIVPIVATQPVVVLNVMVIVTVLLFHRAETHLSRNWLQRMKNDEMITLAGFLKPSAALSCRCCPMRIFIPAST